MPKPLYIAFEGVDGCGKSTQAARLATRLNAVFTKEPGGTDLGAQIRTILLDPAFTGKIDDLAELLLMNADRAQHLREKVLPALQSGQSIVSDRSYFSSLVYQGHVRGLSLDLVHAICGLVLGEVLPHRIFLLDIDIEHVEARRGGDGHDVTDRFEQEGQSFRERLIAGYRAEANRASNLNVVLVDARGSVDEVEQSIWAHVAPLLPKEAS
jgi:dTMP kinase